MEGLLCAQEEDDLNFRLINRHKSWTISVRGTQNLLRDMLRDKFHGQSKIGFGH